MRDLELVIGRDAEIEAFARLLESSGHSIQIVNIYATAGMGKSTLCSRFKEMANDAGRYTAVLDGVSNTISTPEAFCSTLIRSLGEGDVTKDSTASLIEASIRVLNRLALEKGFVLILDSYEQMEHMDQWLRDYFLPLLKGNCLIIIAGRYPLPETWFLTPGWRRRVFRMTPGNLTREEVLSYLQASGITDERSVEQIWLHSKGYPLAVSLAAIIEGAGETQAASHEETGLKWLPYLVNRWLREVPDERMREIVECAATLRHFNQDLLSCVLERKVTTEEFYKLIRLSFVKHTDRGWTFHELMRQATAKELSIRSPQRTAIMRKKALQFYYSTISEGIRKELLPWEAYEFMSYMGDSLIRAYMDWHTESPYRYVPAGLQQRDEIAAYVRATQLATRNVTLELTDPLTQRRFTFNFDSDFSLKWFDVDQLQALGYDVIRVLRDPSGAILGLAVFIPINSKTLPYLLKHPKSSTFFGGLPREELETMTVPENSRAGWFIHTLQATDFSDKLVSASISQLMHSLILTGELIIVSPPPLPYFTRAFESLGFQLSPLGTHTHYGSDLPAHTYVLDTRGRKMLEYIGGMLRRAGLDEIIIDETDTDTDTDTENDVALSDYESDSDNYLSGLTPRQREVASLLMQGMTNAQIATALFLSEYTIKKHLKSLFDRFHVSNRTKLVKLLMEQQH